MQRSWSVAACVAASLWCASARAHPDIDAAKELMGKGDFRAALLKLERAERSPELKEEELVDVHWNRGVIHHTMGNAEKADASFDAVLALRPLYTPDRLETPPPIRTVFHKRTELYAAAHGLELKVVNVKGAVLNVQLVGHPAEAASLVVYARPAGRATYDKAEATTAGLAMAKVRLGEKALWKGLGDAGALEVVLEARNARGVPVARAGDAVAPMKLKVPAEERARALEELEPPPAPAPAPVATPAPEKAPAPPEKPAEKPVEQPRDEKPAPPPEPTKVLVLTRPEPAPSVPYAPPPPQQYIPPPHQPYPQYPNTAPPQAPHALTPTPNTVLPAPQALPAPEEVDPVSTTLRWVSPLLLGGGAVAGALAVLALVSAAASWGSLYLVDQQLRVVGSERWSYRPTLVGAWYGTLVGGVALPVAAGALALGGTGVIIAGAVAAVRAFIL
ncbi:MAG: hypothetical protein HY904_13305 [Deltaproteobacteria bacterium]|nr:hypothetical protein [Deltaproteobacteria bacterium]